jgi:hypothetical protein
MVNSEGQSVVEAEMGRGMEKKEVEILVEDKGCRVVASSIDSAASHNAITGVRG